MIILLFILYLYIIYCVLECHVEFKAIIIMCWTECLAVIGFCLPFMFVFEYVFNSVFLSDTTRRAADRRPACLSGM